MPQEGHVALSMVSLSPSFFFVFFVFGDGRWGFHYLAQDGLELLVGSRDLPTSASRMNSQH